MIGGRIISMLDFDDHVEIFLDGPPRTEEFFHAMARVTPLLVRYQTGHGFVGLFGWSFPGTFHRLQLTATGLGLIGQDFDYYHQFGGEVIWVRKRGYSKFNYQFKLPRGERGTIYLSSKHTKTKLAGTENKEQAWTDGTETHLINGLHVQGLNINDMTFQSYSLIRKSRHLLIRFFLDDKNLSFMNINSVGQKFAVNQLPLATPSSIREQFHRVDGPAQIRLNDTVETIRFSETGRKIQLTYGDQWQTEWFIKAKTISTLEIKEWCRTKNIVLNEGPCHDVPAFRRPEDELVFLTEYCSRFS